MGRLICSAPKLSPRVGETWRKKFSGFQSLLTPESVKIEKSNLSQKRFLNVIQYLAPATMAGGPNLCPCHTEGCYGKQGENCIAGTGRLAMANETLIARTKFFHGDPDHYLERLIAEIEHFREKARECGRKLALRLNGTSDIDWERRAGFQFLFEMFPDVTFYDYTKVANRIVREGKAVSIPKNYHLTFSRSESNQADVEAVVKHSDVNVAVVFETKPSIGGRPAEDLPSEYLGRKVIDGDKHDLRFLDPAGVIVGLRAKGGLRTQMRKPGSPASLFVVRDPHIMKWAEAVAKVRREGVREDDLPLFSTEISGDPHIVAAHGISILVIRSVSDLPPLPRRIATVLAPYVLDRVKERRFVATMTVRELIKACGGPVKAESYRKLILEVENRPLLEVDIPGLDPLFLEGRLVASTIRGAPPPEKIRVERMNWPAGTERPFSCLFIIGSGWRAVVAGMGLERGDTGDRPIGRIGVESPP